MIGWPMSPFLANFNENLVIAHINFLINCVSASQSSCFFEKFYNFFEHI
uniref:Uncharacterized protein n=1 Tax=Rhizophora mucronata TaxID=61149 RepID=A0A2P2IR27_RHIMU